MLSAKLPEQSSNTIQSIPKTHTTSVLSVQTPCWCVSHRPHYSHRCSAPHTPAPSMTEYIHRLLQLSHALCSCYHSSDTIRLRSPQPPRPRLSKSPARCLAVGSIWVSGAAVGRRVVENRFRHHHHRYPRTRGAHRRDGPRASAQLCWNTTNR